MGRKDKTRSKDLHQQAYDQLTSMLAIGESKKADKATGANTNKIYSFSTYHTYWQHIKYFLVWIQDAHPECTTLKAAKRHVNEWLNRRVEQVDENGNRLSAWTIQTEAAALNKLFGIRLGDPGRFDPPRRNRHEIKRSRIQVAQDKHFSKTNNDELIRFCKGTGCRRNILEKLQGRDLWSKSQMEFDIMCLDGNKSLSAEDQAHLSALKDALSVFPDKQYFIHHRRDKNGRSRFAPIIGPDHDQIVDRMSRTPPDQKVWLHVSKHADIHGYRAQYASTIYKEYARDVEEIPFDKKNQGTGKLYQSEVYNCRRDEKGKRLDRVAMRKASKALGHNRIDVVANNYLHAI